MKLSLIICTYNRQQYLVDILNSIASQNYPRSEYEIVLVDNNSTDQTQTICNEWKDEHSDITFRYVKESNQGLSFARNKGIEESEGDIIVYIDDDAKIKDGYLNAVDNFFTDHPTVNACGGPIVPLYEAPKPKWISHYTEALVTAAMYSGKKIKPFKGKKFPSGGNSAYRRKIFELYGNFNTSLGRTGTNLISGEEKDLFYRLYQHDEQVYYVPEMVLFHRISARKLSDAYFNELTYLLGKSEYIRTRNAPNGAYTKRLIAEGIKWAASFILCLGYWIAFSPQKGFKLLHFRWNVTKGLLGK